ncbi:elongation factor Ts [Enterobacteriaceae endosymbiont of Plateumaris consimilis]|uniref:translation elongation factor Ts n=1 Tax=Enterobacteriaceae endosymbiont of Plateumaris consimilis TaxID=2675794 RepID=UPI001449F344|nr:translation elongation factor Ts [Enterobacteriaceae endosymbiont of Plateumaris consimilis]QJC28643.1 elongation factor Ts [Enterobacteriaceae endosymbiont of Plateumaris consimilis]
MIKITANQVKELRNITGIGIMECKKALIETNGNIKLAIDYLRKFLKVQSIKKSVLITKEGFITDFVQNNYGILLEINTQTDFVAKHSLVKNFAKNIIKYSFEKKITNITKIKNIFEEKRIKLIGLMKENIIINRLGIIKGNFIGKYLHHSKRIGVIVQSNINNLLIIKKIAMHIAVLKPQYISKKDVSKKIIQNEYKLQMEIAKQFKKSSNIIEKIVTGRINKFINNITLINQQFLFDSNQTVLQYLNKNNIFISKFIRFELGEKIL